MRLFEREIGPRPQPNPSVRRRPYALSLRNRVAMLAWNDLERALGCPVRCEKSLHETGIINGENNCRISNLVMIYSAAVCLHTALGWRAYISY
jgi:hypothetical protein